MTSQNVSPLPCYFAQSNVAMTSPIMSRFDLFFVIVDECDEVADYNIARHITNLHRNLDEAIDAEYSTEDVSGRGAEEGCGARGGRRREECVMENKREEKWTKPQAHRGRKD